ncbi:hypothetical protein BSL78_05854 [Apostichopus japonicus]|uniref:Fibrinogen C-terminal domain-containing protein n=1 Tax=Stichopus japonicus TaxID=307972 RepID=A0A2G8LAC2_STIJA|nr:hypothetical protein BSL78_05854 [Apostichopus japonicus]
MNILAVILVISTLSGHATGELLHTDCLDVYNTGFTESGVFSIQPPWSDSSFNVFCNMSDGGGWTVFQRRIDGSVNFTVNWEGYKEGFGQLEHEFWLGNEKLYRLTNHGEYQLRIDLVSSEGKPYYAKYDFFRINNESDYYRLSGLGEYNGNAVSGIDPDKAGLRPHLNQTFKAYDLDDNSFPVRYCAKVFEGAWWFNAYCGNTNLNSLYPEYIFWNHLPGEVFTTNNISFTQMSIKPRVDPSNNKT